MNSCAIAMSELVLPVEACVFAGTHRDEPMIPWQNRVDRSLSIWVYFEDGCLGAICVNLRDLRTPCDGAMNPGRSG